MTLPIFSVIIPTYNRRRTIERALTSVFEQRHPPGEVILVDDASDDDTLTFVHSRFPKVRTLRHEGNRGPAVARNAAIQIAKHSHLAFLDSDDAWDDDYLAIVGETWCKHPDAAIVYAQYDKILDRPNGRVDPMDVRVEGDQIEAMLRNNFIHSCSLMTTRRDWTIDVGGFDPAYKIGEDRAMYLRLLLRGPAISVSERLVKRYVAEDNLINNLEQWWQDATSIVARFVAHPDFERFRWVEDQSRARAWEALRWHDRQRKNARRESERATETKAQKPHSPAIKPRKPNRPSNGLPIYLFVHAGGLPIDALAVLLTSVGAFGSPAPWFDHDGPLLEKAWELGALDLESYVDAVLGEAKDAGQPWSALISYRDLLWLQSTTVFQRLMQAEDVRVVRLRCKDTIIQGCRLASERWRGDLAENPSRAAIADAIVTLEETEAFGDAWLADQKLKGSSLWLEDLHEPSLPTLMDLSPENVEAPDIKLEPPSADQLALACTFRKEAARRHWSHALIPAVSAR